MHRFSKRCGEVGAELCLEEQKEEIVEQLDAIQEFSYHVVSVEV
jgi:hypothetical protein